MKKNLVLIGAADSIGVPYTKDNYDHKVFFEMIEKELFKKYNVISINCFHMSTNNDNRYIDSLISNDISLLDIKNSQNQMLKKCKYSGIYPYLELPKHFLNHYKTNDADEKIIVKNYIKNNENGGLFYPTMSLFTANDTIGNKKGYYTEEQYLKLQRILEDKSLDDVSLINCDLFDLPNKVNLKDVSYAYLSNIMDFLVGVDKMRLDTSSLKDFKDYILNILLPVLKENADIDLSYLKSNWHMPNDIDKYLSIYSLDEGFSIRPLSNRRDSILEYESSVLEKNVDNKKY